MSARLFLFFWIGGTLGVLVYAMLDLWAHPSLSVEESFSITPDWSRVGDLSHWGGRLLHHGAWPLLFSNATILGGIIALLVAFAINWIRKKDEEPERISIVDLPEE